MKVKLDETKKELVINFSDMSDPIKGDFANLVRAISTGFDRICGETCQDDLGIDELEKVEKELKKNKLAKKVLKEWWNN